MNAKYYQLYRLIVMEMREQDTKEVCGMTLPTEIISKKWSLNIITELMRLNDNDSGMAALSYSEIHSAIEEISPKMLSTRLQELIEYGIIERIDNDVSPKKVKYRLTESGKAMIFILMEIRKWGKEFGKVNVRRCLTDRCKHSINLQLVADSITHPENF